MVIDRFGIDKTAMVSAAVGEPPLLNNKGGEGDARYSLPQSSRGDHVGCDYEEARNLKRRPYGREILREPQQEALEGPGEITTVPAKDLGPWHHLRGARMLRHGDQCLRWFWLPNRPR